MKSGRPPVGAVGSQLCLREARIVRYVTPAGRRRAFASISRRRSMLKTRDLTCHRLRIRRSRTLHVTPSRLSYGRQSCSSSDYEIRKDNQESTPPLGGSKAYLFRRAGPEPARIRNNVVEPGAGAGSRPHSIDAYELAAPIAAVVMAVSVARADPAGSDKRRASPISSMPGISRTGGIPIASDPRISWSGRRCHVS